MPEVPVLRPGEVVRVFGAHGWGVVRQHGSHIIMTKKGSYVTLSIPNHQTVARGTLRELISKSGLTVDEFLKEVK